MGQGWNRCFPHSSIGEESACNAGEKGKWSRSVDVRLFVTTWTVVYQAPPSMDFSRQEYWSGLPFLSPGDLSDLGNKPGFPAWQADSLPTELRGKPFSKFYQVMYLSSGQFCMTIMKWSEVKSLSRIWLFATPWTVTCQAPLSMGFSSQEYWSGLPFPSPGDLPNPGIQPGSPALYTDALPSELTIIVQYYFEEKKKILFKWSESCSVVSDSLWPHGLYSS